MKDNVLILELYKKVKRLEKRVEKLEKGESENENSHSDLNQEKITRTEARKYVMDKLREHNKDYSIRKGKRFEGSGIVIAYEGDEDEFFNTYIKFYHSNNQKDDRFFGWHKVHKDHIEEKNFNNFGYKFNDYIFTIFFNKKIYAFCLSDTQMRSLIENKPASKNGIYHLHFEKIGKKFYETRDRDDKYGYDVTEYLNRWEIMNILPKEPNPKIIKEQDKVHGEIFLQKHKEKGLVRIDKDEYPNEDEYTIMLEGTYPFEEGWMPSDIKSSIKKVFLDISLKESSDLMAISDIVDYICEEIPDDINTWYTSSPSEKSHKKIKVFLVL